MFTKDNSGIQESTSDKFWNKIEFNALLSTIPEATTDDESEDIDNPAQLKIALEMEQRKKPHLQALNEFLDGKIDFEYKK